jgi:hypothetical protein
MDITEAVKTVVMLDLALLKAEIETGTYKKPIKALAADIRYEPLPGEIRAVIIAWQRGGLPPKPLSREWCQNRLNQPPPPSRISQRRLEV